MEVIGIADFEKLVSERLSNPKEYANRTLLLWHGHYTPDSIESKVIQQCCLNYNMSHADDRVGFMYSDFGFQDEDYSKCRVYKNYKGMTGDEHCRILFNTGCFIVQEETDNWIKFMNTRTNNKGQLPEDCVLIACVHTFSCYTFKEEQFSDNCDIVCLKPSIKEWSQWMSSRCNPETLEYLLSFIESEGIETDCFYLGRIIRAIDNRLWVDKLQSVNQLSQSLFDIAVGGASPSFPSHDFWEFIQARK